MGRLAPKGDAMMTELDTDSVSMHRIERFMALGFDSDEAFILLDARGTDKFLLSHHDVRKYIEGGATKEQILQIFSS